MLGVQSDNPFQLIFNYLANFFYSKKRKVSEKIMLNIIKTLMMPIINDNHNDV